MSLPEAVLNPRKTPVQRRSAATIGVIHAATIQVLTHEGLSRCTTTRVAERAGVSVGSIYQYYPNRDALLAAVLTQHLDGVLAAVQKACGESHGKPMAVMASVMVETYLSIKLRDPKESKALYAVAGERGGPQMASQLSVRLIDTIEAMLKTAPDGSFADPRLTAAIVLNAIAGPVQALLNNDIAYEGRGAIQRELTALISAYLGRGVTGGESVDSGAVMARAH